VLVNTPALSASASGLPGGILRVCDTHDVWHEKYRNFAALGHGAVLDHFQDPADEARLLKPFDLIVAITGRDAAALRRLVPGATVITAGVSFRPVVLDRTGAEGPPTVLFVGGRGIENEDGVGFFIDQVWPCVRARVPEAEFVVLAAAAGLRGRYARSPGVRLLGHVRDLGEWYGKAHVVVEPRRFGTGLKIKVIEALAHGSAMVISPAAAQGLPARDGVLFLLRETPEAFADGVTHLLVEPAARMRLGAQAQRFVGEELTPERVYAELREALVRRAARPAGARGS
jgi:succinoglycan biosynthesis protein ExoO